MDLNIENFLSEETNKSFQFIRNHVLVIWYKSKHFKSQFRDSFKNVRYFKGKKENGLFENGLPWNLSTFQGFFFFICVKFSENSVFFNSN